MVMSGQLVNHTFPRQAKVMSGQSVIYIYPDPAGPVTYVKQQGFSLQPNSTPQGRNSVTESQEVMFFLLNVHGKQQWSCQDN